MGYDEAAVKAELKELSLALELVRRDTAYLLWVAFDLSNSSVALIRYDNHIVEVTGATIDELYNMLAIERLQLFAEIEHTPVGEDGFVRTRFTGKPLRAHHWFETHRKADGHIHHSQTIAEAEIAHRKLVDTHP